MQEQITLYSCKGSPYAHHVEIVLEEAKARYTRYEVDLLNKPAWFVEKVNPAGKVPAMTYGGLDVPPEQPSEKSHKLAESQVLIEFVTDLYPDAPLMPKDPILRASARFFINAVTTRFSKIYLDCMIHRKSPDQILDAISDIQKLLPDENLGKYAVGNTFTNADAVAAGWLLLQDAYLQRDIGSYKEGEGRRVYEVLHTSPKYARYRAYLAALRERESVKKTYDEAFILKTYSSFYLSHRA